MDLLWNCYIHHSFLLLSALPGHDYILQSQTLIFMYDEVHNISNTPCVNVTILDDDIPENDKFIILRLSMASYDQNLAITSAGKNQTVIKILDNDHGMLLHVCYSIMNSIQLALYAEN